MSLPLGKSGPDEADRGHGERLGSYQSEVGLAISPLALRSSQPPRHTPPNIAHLNVAQDDGDHEDTRQDGVQVPMVTTTQDINPMSATKSTRATPILACTKPTTSRLLQPSAGEIRRGSSEARKVPWRFSMSRYGALARTCSSRFSNNAREREVVVLEPRPQTLRP